MTNKIQLYVLNDFLKFERKLYSLFGINLGRTIQFKTITYFVTAAGFIFLLGLVPILGAPIASLSVFIRVGIAGGIAVLLTDVGTENRPPLNALVSFIRYHWQSARHTTYYKGRVLERPRPVRFRKVTRIQEPTRLKLKAPRTPKWRGLRKNADS